jgi:hypothetical protein
MCFASADNRKIILANKKSGKVRKFLKTLAAYELPSDINIG